MRLVVLSLTLLLFGGLLRPQAAQARDGPEAFTLTPEANTPYEALNFKPQGLENEPLRGCLGAAEPERLFGVGFASNDGALFLDPALNPQAPLEVKQQNEIVKEKVKENEGDFAKLALALASAAFEILVSLRKFKC